MDGMRIVWLAAADARGHLMRAHVMRGLLATHGVTVDVVTTSPAGCAFLAALGTPAELLSSHYGVAFDDWQNMVRARTEACVLRYLLMPNGARADACRLAELCEGAALLVNDFHPLLLARRHREAPAVVHVYGRTLWRAIERNFAGRGPGFVDHRFAKLVRRLRARAYARIEHTIEIAPAHARIQPHCDHLLPALIAAPVRSRAEVRASLGVEPGQKLAAIYLNPHFSHSALPYAIERALDSAGWVTHAVAEGFAGRPGWRAYDPGFVDKVAAADVLISAPGMAAVGQAAAFGTPMIALSTDQPEQAANAAALANLGRVPLALLTVTRDHGDLDARLRAALREVAAVPRPRSDARRTVAAIHACWRRSLLRLLAADEAVHCSTRRHA
jgi:hypothetical protein